MAKWRLERFFDPAEATLGLDLLARLTERIRMSGHRFAVSQVTLALTLALFSVSVFFPPAPAWARAAPESFAPIVRELLPAVVNISTTQEVEVPPRGQMQGPQRSPFPQGSPFEGSPLEDFFREFFGDRVPESRQRRLTALGSGFVIDPAGIIVTNNHVIANATRIQVVFQDDRTFEATVIGRDPSSDLAVLKIEADEPLHSVKWGRSDTAEVGDWVIAIGNPFGLGGSVTAGVLSAHARDIRAGPYDEFLQTDASINRGNSGGPLFNTNGEVIGVNTVILSPTGGNIGIGFAVPSSIAQPVVQQLVETGEVRRGFIGVTIQPVTEEIAEALGLEAARGALVSEIEANGPAAQAGLQPGDVIVEFDGTAIREVRELPRVVAATEIGRTVDVVVSRDGERIGLEVDVARRPGDVRAEGREETPDERDDPEEGRYGLALAPLTAEVRERLGIGPEVESGVVVTSIIPGGVADGEDIRGGDVIVEVNRQPVNAPADVVEQLESARTAGQNNVLLRIFREDGHIFVTLPVIANGAGGG
jgi:serine protease Do